MTHSDTLQFVGRTVIVIDDDTVIRDILCRLLEEIGLRVIGRGGTGDEAVELYRTLTPDVVCLDIEMPNTNGIEALSAIRNLDANAVIVMITGAVDRENVRASVSERASGMIAKPFSASKLAAEMARVLER